MYSIVQLYLLLYLIIYPLSCYLYMLLLYLFHAILSVVAYYVCICILCIAYSLISIYLADIIPVYAQHRIMVILHMPICMCTSITPPLTCSFLSHHHQTTLFIISTGYDYRHDPMITGQVVMVLKEDMFLYFYCLLYGITITKSYLLLSCLYYYSTYYCLLHFTTHQSLSDDPEFACPGWRSELPNNQILPWSHIGDYLSSSPFIGIFVIYLCYLIYPCFSICCDH